MRESIHIAKFRRITVKRFSHGCDTGSTRVRDATLLSNLILRLAHVRFLILLSAVSRMLSSLLTVVKKPFLILPHQLISKLCLRPTVRPVLDGVMFCTIASLLDVSE